MSASKRMPIGFAGLWDRLKTRHMLRERVARARLIIRPIINIAHCNAFDVGLIRIKFRLGLTKDFLQPFAEQIRQIR